MCQINGANTIVQHYYNSNLKSPSLLLPSNPTIGLSNANISINNRVLSCLVTRQKNITGFSKYFDISTKQYYLLAAYGQNNGLSNFKIVIIKVQIHMLSLTMFKRLYFKHTTYFLYFE